MYVLDGFYPKTRKLTLMLFWG